MNQLRQPFSELSPEVYKGLVQASIALEKSELGNALVELVYLRVSQINGCAFCLEKHSQALRKGGMAQRRHGAKQTGCPCGLAGKRPLYSGRTRGAGLGRVGHRHCRQPCGR